MRTFAKFLRKFSSAEQRLINVSTSFPFHAFNRPTLMAVVANVSDEEMQEHYDNFFEDVFVECEDRYGEIEEMNVCDNLGDHLVGNVYIKVSGCLSVWHTNMRPNVCSIFHSFVLFSCLFAEQFRREEDAERAAKELNNRWFGGRPVYSELSPVTDFREACCRQYEMGECTRSGFCNFMHLKPISRDLRRYGNGIMCVPARAKRIFSRVQFYAKTNKKFPHFNFAIIGLLPPCADICMHAVVRPVLVSAVADQNHVAAHVRRRVSDHENVAHASGLAAVTAEDVTNSRSPPDAHDGQFPSKTFATHFFGEIR